MRDALRKLKPDCFEDIVAMNALYRPGPMDNIPRYINCKHGIEQPEYLHPLLEPILKETYGVIIYQEQVMQIARELAGYSLGGADLLRRAMGKKIKAEMDAQREVFIDGASEHRLLEPARGDYTRGLRGHLRCVRARGQAHPAPSLRRALRRARRGRLIARHAAIPGCRDE
jgi:DNA polymerase-3 subunit alpha